MTERFFIFGAGYSGLAIAAELRRLYGKNAVICGTTRKIDRLPLLRAAGIAPVLFDGQNFGGGKADIAAAKQALSEADHCIISIPPLKNACIEAEIAPALAAVREMLNSGESMLKSLAYLSAIGVYGDAQGAWLNEDSPLRAALPQNIIRRQAEIAWAELGRAHNLPYLILRFGGIYGGNLAPAGFSADSGGVKGLSRNPFARLAAGTARRIVKAGQVSNRIHAADIGGALCHLLAQKADGIYNLCDGHPVPPQDIIAFAAALMSINPPEPEPFETAIISSALRAFYLDNRRIANAKLLSRGYQFRYPDYKTGLTEIWRSGNW